MSLIAKNITKIYGNQKALDDVSFEIKTGQIVGFLGPNGAGKSTMMKIITGYLSQNQGDVSVNDLNVREDSLEVRRLIGYLPEHNPLYTDMYVREYLNYVSGIYKLTDIKTKVDNIIKLTGLEIEQNKKIAALSKGYKQRVGLAAALIHDPEVLILDEPTTGLDPNQIIEIRNLILEVGKEKTVMLSTHIMQEVEAICSRVIILDSGKIVADNPVGEIENIGSENNQIIVVEFDQEPDENKLRQIEGVVEIIEAGENMRIIKATNDNDIRPLIFNYAVENKLTVLSMQKKEKNIEDVFRELTGK